MSIMTIVIGDSREQVLAHRPPERPGFKRNESLEDFTVTGTTACGKCGVEHIDPRKQTTQWRLSVVDTK